MNLLIFGDSITWGAWDREGGWVSRVRRVVDAKVLASNFEYYCAVYNLGISGDKTTDLLERFERELEARVEPHDDTLVLFAIGINDSQFYVQGKQHKVPPEQFEKNINKLIELAKKRTSKIAFVGLTPVEDDKLNPMPWAPDRAYGVGSIQEYDRILRKVCTETNTGFVELFDVFPAQSLPDVLSDGLHPNDAGHALIANQVQKYLLEKGWL